MLEVGKLNTLRVAKILDFGIYLDAGEAGEILMPTKWVPEGTLVNHDVEAFVYFDSEDRLIATTQTPKAMVGEFGYLMVKQVNNIGAFLDWGLDKDLFVPFKEQNAKMVEGKHYLVYLYIDMLSKRITATARLEKFLDIEAAVYKEGEEVDLIIWTRSDLGYKAIINQKHIGMLFENEIFKEISTGTKLKGYIKKLRPDGKIDLFLEKPGYEKIDALSAKILEVLGANNGFIGYNDKSPADDIYRAFQMSKKNFKKSIGTLYKQKLILIENNGIRKL
ncbi:MAG: GntR family transcriptional regulator [Bacteroidetes bacterium]|nr:GntR family transcriptional regulator [Bacteroidota bacterium]